MLESLGLPAQRHWRSLSQPRAPCRAARVGGDPKTVLGQHPHSESELGDLSRAIFMKNKVMGNFHPKALWTLRVSSPTSDCGYQGCLLVRNWEVFPWKPAVLLWEGTHTMAQIWGLHEWCSAWRGTSPAGALGAAVPWLHGMQPREALLCHGSSMREGDPRPWGQAMAVATSSPPAFPPHPPGAPASTACSSLASPFVSFPFPLLFLSLSSPCSTPLQTPLWGIDFSIRQRNA